MSDLNRIRHLAGLLTESIVSVPGMGKQEQPNEVDGMFDNNGATQGMEEAVVDEGSFKEVIQQKIQRARELQGSMVEPEEVSDMIAAELEQEGFESQDVLNILDAISQELTGDDEDDHDDTCPTCTGTGIGQHGDPDTSRCSDCGGSGVLRGESDYDEDPPEREYDTADDIYEDQTNDEIIDDDSELNEDELEEAYDLNNGYEDVKYAKGSDYFPTGADSPVTSHTGPSGARQGDNPEQKRMEVAEAHKELVYNYRKFLKESVKN
jgi:hypothetical protein